MTNTTYRSPSAVGQYARPQNITMDSLSQYGAMSNSPSNALGLNNVSNPGYDFAMSNSNQVLPNVSSDLPMSAGGGAGGEMGMMQKLFGGTSADGSTNMGYVPAAMGVGSTLLNGYLGMKQYGLAKDQLKFSKEAFNTNVAMQKKTINNRTRSKAMDSRSGGLSDAEIEQHMQQYGVQ